MADYRQSILTVNGRMILARAIAGDARIVFKDIKTSDTIYTEEQLPNLTDIGDIKQVSPISSYSESGESCVSLTSRFVNDDLTVGYYVRNFGIYVEDPDNKEKELLYAIVNADESVHPASMIPAFNGVSHSGITFTAVISVDSSTNVTVVIDPTGSVNISTFNEHTDSGVFSETGVHGIRYKEDVLQVRNNGGDWIDAGTGGGIAPNNVSDLRVITGNGKLTIVWKDPEDTVIEDQTLVTWSGTKLVYKVGSYPENVKDGTILVDNKDRGKYSNTGFEIGGLTNGETYYFQLFPYSDTKSVNNNITNRATGTPQEYVVFGVEIDLSNSNPNTWATYTDDAVGMVAGSDAWDDKQIFRDIYSCLFKNGVEVKKLKKGDPTKFEDGTTADITSGNSGDVMTKFTRAGYRIITNGTKLSVQITDDPNKEGFCYKAFKRGNVEKNQFYLGRYKGSVISNKLRSLSGKTPTGNQTIGTFRTQAQNNGTGYENSGWYQLVFRQCLYIIKYLAKNSQQSVGQGYVNNGSSPTSTGGTNGKGETYGTTSTAQQMILFGIEDFWGNIWEWVDGLVSNGSRELLTGTDKFNDAGTGYENQGNGGVTSNIGNYMSVPQGTSDKGFVAKSVSGSATTYFCDYAGLSASCVAKFGGVWGDGDGAGVFQLSVNNASSYAGAYIGGRLMYL